MASDQVFTDKRIVAMVTDIARTFRVNPSLLAEHMVGEMDFENYTHAPKGVKFDEWIKGRTIETSAAGLDDFVKERDRIERAVPQAKNIGPGIKSSSMPAESDVNKYARRLEPVPPKLFKPQRKFSMVDAVRASAAYLKYKEKMMRNGIGDAEFDTLPLPVKFQLIRLAINPTKLGEGKDRGIRHWIKVTKRGELADLFDFRPLTAGQTTDTTKPENVVRRATIHTARSLHMAETIFHE
jgi:hypothetical protein